MSVLDYPLHIKDGDTVYECECYTDIEEATPTIGSEMGSAWEIKNNGTTCYVGLWNMSNTASPVGGAEISPLRIKKNGVEYGVVTKVVNTYLLIVTRPVNQDVILNYYDSTNTLQTLEVQDEEAMVDALAGTEYTYTTVGHEGYDANDSGSGIMSSEVRITVSNATLKYFDLSVGATTYQTYAVAFTADSAYGGTLPSGVTGQSAAKTFSCPYGATATVTYTKGTRTGYSVTASSAVTKTMTSAQSVPAATASTSLLYYNLSCGATTNQKYAVTFTKNSTYGGTLPSNVSGQTAAKTFSCPYGSTAKVTYTANARTASTQYTATAARSYTMTSAQTCAAASASGSTVKYSVKINNTGFSVITYKTSSSSFTSASGGTSLGSGKNVTVSLNYGYYVGCYAAEGYRNSAVSYTGLTLKTSSNGSRVWQVTGSTSTTSLAITAESDTNGSTCFLAGTQVTCVDENGLLYEQNIEDVKQGDKVLGANGVVNTMVALDVVYLGSLRKAVSIDVNGRTLKATPEHKLWVRKNGTEYWGIFDKVSAARENTVVVDGLTGVDLAYRNALDNYNIPYSWLEPENPEQTRITKQIPILQLDKGVEEEYGTLNGWRKGVATEIEDLPPDTPVYALLVDGNRTYFVDSVLASSRAYAADIDWLNYVDIKELTQ